MAPFSVDERRPLRAKTAAYPARPRGGATRPARGAEAGAFDPDERGALAVPYFLIGTQAGNLTALTIENIVPFALPVVGASVAMYPTTFPKNINPTWDPTTMAMTRIQISRASWDTR